MEEKALGLVKVLCPIQGKFRKQEWVGWRAGTGRRV
jgi:ribosome modulation factor